MPSCIINLSGRLSAVLVVVMLSVFAQASAADKVALLLANSSYSNDALPSLEVEFKLLASELKEHEFRVLVASDENHAVLRKRIQEFVAAARGSELALVFYAGHALKLGPNHYLVPTDATLTSRSDIRKLMRLKEILNVASRKTRLVAVLDTCWKSSLAEGWGDSKARAPVCAERQLQDDISSSATIVFPESSLRQAGSTSARTNSLAGVFAGALAGERDPFDFDDFFKAATRRYASLTGAEPVTFGDLPTTEIKRRPVGLVAQQPAAPVVVPEPPSASTKVELFIAATPPTSTIRILNIGPSYRPGMLLDPGKVYDISVEAPGYLTFRTQHVLVAGQPPLQVDLQPAPVDTLPEEKGREERVASGQVSWTETAAPAQPTKRVAAVGTQELQVTVEMFNSVKDALVARDIATINRLVAPSVARNRMNRMIEEYSAFQADIVLFSGSATSSEVSAVLRIRRMVKEDGAVIFPARADGDLPLKRMRLGDSTWSGVLM